MNQDIAMGHPYDPRYARYVQHINTEQDARQLEQITYRPGQIVRREEYDPRRDPNLDHDHAVFVPVEDNWQTAPENIQEPKEGVKHDSGKPMMSLLDSEWKEGVARVMTFGAKKYAAHNWRKGISVSRLLDAAYRHQDAFNKGEDLDPESGESHLFHASCCLQFASWMVKHRPDLDDRYKGEV
jgi:hypothetical protein